MAKQALHRFSLTLLRDCDCIDRCPSQHFAVLILMAGRQSHLEDEVYHCALPDERMTDYFGVFNSLFRTKNFVVGKLIYYIVTVMGFVIEGQN